MSFRIVFFLGLFFCRSAFGQVDPDVKPPDARGIYAIWYGKNKDVFDLPYVKGGQITLQWADVEPQQGKYDFSALDAALAVFAAAQKRTTVQVNGNNKPQWMYGVIPHHAQKLSHQIQDNEGTLMFWHPLFIQTYINFVKAYAAHLKSSPFLSSLAGVRMNFNALGTEQLDVPAENRSLDQWMVPKAGTQGPAYTPETSRAYQDLIASTFINEFAGINLFLRNNISLEVENKFKQKFLDGKLMLFHTSSEIEPRNPMMEHNYDLFKKYARSGHTLAYAESWADSWGYHGGQQDPRWTSPAQYTYWRLLSDLNAGVSLIAVYGNDLRIAIDGQHPKEGDEKQYRQSFEQAFRFASMYAGYHASPSLAPGAWVAFRHNEKNASYKELKEFTDNYSYLMTQLPPDNTEWQNLSKMGPPLQRFGAWAKVLQAAQKLRLQLSGRFAASLKGAPAVVRVIYLDESKGAFTTTFSGKTTTTALTGTGQWKTVEIPVQSAAFVRDDLGADVILTATDGNITFHMVNVERGNGLPNNVQKATASFADNAASIHWQNPSDYDIDHINIYSDNKLVLTLPMTAKEALIRAATRGNKIRITTVDEAGRESVGITLNL